MTKRLKFWIVISAIIQTFITAVIALMIYDLIRGDTVTYLEGRQYESIEALSEDLIKETDIQAVENDDDFWPKEFAFSISIEDKVFCFYKYASTKNGNIKEDSLYIDVVKMVNDKYVLETPYYGFGKWGVLYLNQETSLESNKYFLSVKINGEKRSVYFFYKQIDEVRKIYYDGVETEEIEMMNPFDGSPFILCYGLSHPDFFVNKSHVKTIE